MRLSIVWLRRLVFEYGSSSPISLDLCADDEDPSQLIIRLGWDAPHVRCFRERSVLGLVCLDKWVRFSALHMTMSYRDLHTLTPGPNRLGIRAGLTVGLV